MKTLFKKVDYTVSLLIENIELGVIGLPDIQRPFVWKASKVRDLFDSMYNGFPIGYFLFWTSSTENGARQIGTDTKQKAPNLLIVDGQQRLTSMYSIIKGKPVLDDEYRHKKIRIAFKPKDGTFSVTDAAVERDPEYIPDISEIWNMGTSHIRYVNGFIKKLSNHRELSHEEEDTISHNIDKVYDLHDYPMTALEISSSVDEEQVAEIFVRINSQGITLNQADFILTLMSVFWDEGRYQLEAFSRSAKKPDNEKPSPFNYFIKPSPDQMLRCGIGLGFRRARLKYAYSILRGKDLQTEKFSDEMREKQFSVLKESQAYTLNIENWHLFIKCLMLAGFKGESQISSEMGLLYSYIFYLIGKKDFNVEHTTLRKTIARWFFMQSLTRRYTGSPETVMEGDLAKFRDIANPDDFINVINRIIDDTLTDDYWNITLVNELSVSTATSPALFAYYASLVILDANVLFSNMKVSELLDHAIKSTKSPVERHHLFPRNYLKGIGISDIKETNQIANFALVEWQDNIKISDYNPSEYAPNLINKLDQTTKEKMYYWHALPESWENMEYTEFLIARRKLMAKVIRDGFERMGR